MSCNSITLNGINSSCDSSMGGITSVFLAPYAEITGVTADSAGTVTGFTFADSAKTETTVGWKLFKFRKGTSSLTKAYTKDDANGVAFVESTLSMLFTRMDAAKRAELVSLASGGVLAVVKDSNGAYWLLGRDEEVVVNEMGGQTGQAKTDGNYYNVSLLDSSKELPYELSASLGASIEAVANSSAS